MSEGHNTNSQDFLVSPLRKRREFIAMRAGVRQHMSTFLLQMKYRDGSDEQKNPINKTDARVGFTVTKKTGNAVERNRIKRRLRDAIQRSLPNTGRASHDYVVIGKRAALNSDFQTIVRELSSALKRVHQKNHQKPKQSGHRHG